MVVLAAAAVCVASVDLASCARSLGSAFAGALTARCQAHPRTERARWRQGAGAVAAEPPAEAAAGQAAKPSVLDVDGPMEDDWGVDDDDEIDMETAHRQYARQQLGVSDREAEFWEKLYEAKKNGDELDFDWQEEMDTISKEIHGEDRDEIDLFANVGGGQSNDKWTNIILNDTWEFRVAQVPGCRQQFVNMMMSETVVDERNLELFNAGDAVWPASIILARYLAIKPSPVKLENRTVMELGAGVGLPSLAASMLGAERVLLVDRLEPPLQEALESAVENNVSEKILTLRSEWLDLPGRLFNATEEVLQPFARADIILGSDILYEDRLATAFADTLGELLREPGQAAYVVDPYRRQHRKLFAKRCKEHGLSVTDAEIVTWEPEWRNAFETDHDWTCHLLTVRRPS